MKNNVNRTRKIHAISHEQKELEGKVKQNKGKTIKPVPFEEIGPGYSVGSLGLGRIS